MEEYCRAGQVTADSMACVHGLHRNTHSEYIILLLCHCSNGLMMCLGLTSYIHCMSCLVFGAFSLCEFTPVTSLVNCGCSSFLLQTQLIELRTANYGLEEQCKKYRSGKLEGAYRLQFCHILFGTLYIP